MPPIKKIPAPTTSNEQQPEPKLRSFHDFDFRPVESEPRAGIAGEPVNFSIVNTPGNGKRVTMAGDIFVKLGAPDKLNFAITDTGVCIAGKLPECVTSFPVCRQGKKDKIKENSKAIVYSSGLVDELTDAFDLDFTGRTTISFQEIEYIDVDGAKAIYVPIKSEPPQATEDSDEVVLAEEEISESAEQLVSP